MRSSTSLSLVLVALAFASAALWACSGNNSNSGFGDADSGSGSGGGSGGTSGGSSGGSSGSSSGGFVGDGGLLGDGSSPTGPEGGTTVKITVYAHTDDTLYSVDPMTQAVTMIGPMVGTSDSSTDSTITDLAVDGAGDVYVNSESVVYKANLPSSGTGTVQLTKVTTISSSSKFYALAFAPAGALDPNNETLIGGDSTGSLWSINTTSGAATNLGNFGADPSTPGNTLELSGDIVFYNDSNNKPTGLATIRSCGIPSGSTYVTCGADYLAGVDMTKLKAAYGGTAQTTLLGGIYGGSGNSLGNGTSFHDVFGLGAWNSTVFGFTRHTTTKTNPQSPQLITIDTTSGVGTPVSGASFSFTNGWSGAGVTTKVTITVAPPPPPPAQ